jgi:transcriptional regulator with XRE-family HTH domain
MISLGQRIRELRMKKGLTQIELAEGLCTPSMVSQLEANKAKPSYRMLFALAERLDTSLEKLLDHVELGMEYKSKYTLAKALIEADQYQLATSLLEELLHSQRTDISTTDLMFQLAMCYMNTSQFHKAESMFAAVAEWATVRNDREMLARIRLALAVVAVRRKEIPIAIYHTQTALHEFQKGEVADPSLHVHILFQLASLNEQIGMVDRAAEYYQHALFVYESMSDLKGLGKTYIDLAETYQKKGNYQKSQEYAAHALSVYKTMGDQAKMMDMERQLILLDHQRQDGQEAVQRLLEFVAVYEAQSDKERAGEVYAEIASLCLEDQNLDEAWGYAEKARLILGHDHPAMGKVHRVLAFVYFGSNETEKGYRHLDNAVMIYEQTGQLSQLQETTLHLCHYLSEQGRDREAFERMERLHDYLIKKLDERGIVL